MMFFGLLRRTLARSWFRVMSRGNHEHRGVAAHIARDSCLSYRSFVTFCLALRHRPRSSDANEASEFAVECVQFDERLRFTGQHVTDSAMQLICRADPAELFLKRLDADGQLAAARLGLTVDRLHTNGQQELDRLMRGGHFQIEVGNLIGITWVVDRHNVGTPVPDLDDLLDGLGKDPDRRPHILVTYNREESPSKEVHVPRCLDAIDHYRFNPVTDCSSATGLTKPISSTAAGLAEGIHSQGFVTPVHLEYCV